MLSGGYRSGTLVENGLNVSLTVSYYAMHLIPVKPELKKRLNLELCVTNHTAQITAQPENDNLDLLIDQSLGILTECFFNLSKLLKMTPITCH